MNEFVLRLSDVNLEDLNDPKESVEIFSNSRMVRPAIDIIRDLQQEARLGRFPLSKINYARLVLVLGYVNSKLATPAVQQDQDQQEQYKKVAELLEKIQAAHLMGVETLPKQPIVAQASSLPPEAVPPINLSQDDTMRVSLKPDAAPDLDLPSFADPLTTATQLADEVGVYADNLIYLPPENDEKIREKFRYFLLQLSDFEGKQALLEQSGVSQSKDIKDQLDRIGDGLDRIRELLITNWVKSREELAKSVNKLGIEIKRTLSLVKPKNIAELQAEYSKADQSIVALRLIIDELNNILDREVALVDAEEDEEIRIRKKQLLERARVGTIDSAQKELEARVKSQEELVENNVSLIFTDIAVLSDIENRKSTLLSDVLSDPNLVKDFEQRVKSIKTNIQNFKYLLSERMRADIENRVSEALATLDSTKEVGSLNQLETDINEFISINNRTIFKIDPQNNEVRTRYTGLYQRVERAKEAHVQPAERIFLARVEGELLVSEFGHLVRSYVATIKEVEGSDEGMSSLGPMMRNVWENAIFGRMEQIVTELNARGDARVTEIEADRRRLKEDYGARLSAVISWVHTFGPLLESAERQPPEKLVKDSFPLSGDNIEYIIKSGFLDDLKNKYGFESSNVKLGQVTPQKATIESWNHVGNETLTVEETAVGHCMRLFDKVVKGEKKIVVNSVEINSTNLHTTYKSLIDYIAEEEAGGQNRFDKHMVMRAFKLWIMLTMNHSYLPEKSPTVSDYLYYLFNWMDYAIKYDQQSIDFEPFITFMMFGFRDVDPVDILYDGKGDKVVEELRKKYFEGKKPEEDEKQYQISGYPSYEFLATPPLISLIDMSHDTHPKTPVFSPPLQYFVLRKPGSKTPVRYPDQNDEYGRYVTLDDFQNIDGERLYEAMDFSMIGDQLLEYYDQLYKNGMGFLNKIVKVSREKFLSTMDSADQVAAIKNQIKYTSSLLSKVGPLLRHAKDDADPTFVESYKKFGDEVMNKMIVFLIYTTCLMRTDSFSDEAKARWGFTEVRDYLDRLAAKHVITHRDADAIYVAVQAGSRMRVMTMNFADRMKEQVKKATQYR